MIKTERGRTLSKKNKKQMNFILEKKIEKTKLTEIDSPHFNCPLSSTISCANASANTQRHSVWKTFSARPNKCVY